MSKTSLGTVLTQTIGTALRGYETTVIGSTVNAKIESGRHVAIAFCSNGYADHWTGIELRLVSKEHGILETQQIPFAEVFASMIDLNHPNKIDKHVWRHHDGCGWYGKPTPQDLSALRGQIKAYLELVE